MILAELAEFVLDARESTLSDQTTQSAVRAVVDWHGAAVAGSVMRPAQIMRKVQDYRLSGGAASLLPDAVKTDEVTAALINGTASHTAEVDDIFRDGLFHPGAPTIACARALAERERIGGETFLRAVVIGYELGCKIAEVIQPGHYENWHTTGTVGVLGSAAAAGEILGLNGTQLQHALATATTMAAGLQQALRGDSMSKPLHAGHAASAGVLAARLAELGYTGALDVLDGPRGFGAATSQGLTDWSLVPDRLGRPWSIEAITVKRHACCGHTFAAVDALLELRAAGIRAKDVERIDVATYATAIEVAGISRPHSVSEAKFSISYCVATALVRGSLGLDAFTDDLVADRAILRLMEGTRVFSHAAFDDAYPQRRGAGVQITTRSGSILEATRLTRRGDPDDPLSDSEIHEKFQELVAPVIGNSRAKSWASRLWQITQCEPVGSVFEI